MSFMVLTDTDNKRSVLFCTTTERPLDCEAFIGEDSSDQAEDFLVWLGCDPRDGAALKSKGYGDGPLNGAWYPALDHATFAWHALAFDADGNFTPVAPW